MISEVCSSSDITEAAAGIYQVPGEFLAFAERGGIEDDTEKPLPSRIQP